MSSASCSLSSSNRWAFVWALCFSVSYRRRRFVTCTDDTSHSVSAEGDLGGASRARGFHGTHVVQVELHFLATSVPGQHLLVRQKLLVPPCSSAGVAGAADAAGVAAVIPQAFAGR